jgi:hypothetical protein
MAGKVGLKDGAFPPCSPRIRSDFVTKTEIVNRGNDKAATLPIRMKLERGDTNSNTQESTIKFGNSPLREKVTRSGTRIPCEIPVTLTSLEPNRLFADSCLVVLVNPQGCAARFRRPVEIGTPVQLEGLPSNNSVAARVVNCISMGECEKFWLLGLDLMEPGNVWGVQTPPEDWTL